VWLIHLIAPHFSAARQSYDRPRGRGRREAHEEGHQAKPCPFRAFLRRFFGSKEDAEDVCASEGS